MSQTPTLDAQWSEPIQSMTVERCKECARIVGGYVDTHNSRGMWFGFYTGPNGVTHCASAQGNHTERAAAAVALYSLAQSLKILYEDYENCIDRIKLPIVWIRFPGEEFWHVSVKAPDVGGWSTRCSPTRGAKFDFWEIMGEGDADAHGPLCPYCTIFSE